MNKVLEYKKRKVNLVYYNYNGRIVIENKEIMSIEPFGIIEIDNMRLPFIGASCYIEKIFIKQPLGKPDDIYSIEKYCEEHSKELSELNTKKFNVQDNKRIKQIRTELFGNEHENY